MSNYKKANVELSHSIYFSTGNIFDHKLCKFHTRSFRNLNREHKMSKSTRNDVIPSERKRKSYRNPNLHEIVRLVFSLKFSFDIQYKFDNYIRNLIIQLKVLNSISAEVAVTLTE